MCRPTTRSSSASTTSQHVTTPWRKASPHAACSTTDNYMNGATFADSINQTFRRYARTSTPSPEPRLHLRQSNSRVDTASPMVRHATEGSKSTTSGSSRCHASTRCFRGNNTKLVPLGSTSRNSSSRCGRLDGAPPHPAPPHFLAHVKRFDSVDNEATIDLPFSTLSVGQWTAVETRPTTTTCYHLWPTSAPEKKTSFRSSRASTSAPAQLRRVPGPTKHLIGASSPRTPSTTAINLKHDPSMSTFTTSPSRLAVSP